MEAVDTREYVSSMMNILASDLTMLEGLTPLCRNTAGVLADLDAPAIVAIAGTRINLLGMFQLEIYYSRGVNEKLLRILKVIGITDSELGELHQAKLIKIHGIFSRFTKDITFSKDLVLDECINEKMKTLQYNRAIKALLRSEINSEQAFNFFKEKRLNYFRGIGENLKEVVCKISKYLCLRRKGDQSPLIDLKRDIELKRAGCGFIKASNMLVHYPILLERFALCKEMISFMKKYQFVSKLPRIHAPILEPASSLKEVECSEK